MTATHLPPRAIALAAAILGTLIALCWAFFRHSVPPEVVITGTWSICGTPIALPFEVQSLDAIFMDDEEMMFGIRDGQGRVTMVTCPWTGDGADPERLFFHASFPNRDGTWPDPAPVEITRDRDLVRNVLFHAMAQRGFHSRSIERKRAFQLYASPCDRLLFRLLGP
jgi:hypothetical protein